jgi:hypothetical protein
MRTALLVIAGILLVGVGFLWLVLPGMKSSELRDAARALVAGADAAKQQIGSAAEKAGKLDGAGSGIKLAPKVDAKHGEMQWLVSDNGAIRGWNKANALEVTITPSFQAGKTSWSCKGYPVDAMPASCGGRS